MKRQTSKTSLIIFGLFLSFCVALIVLIAIDKGVILPLIIGVVIIAVALIVAAWAIVKHVAVPFMETRFKYLDVHLEHERRILELRLKHSAPQLPPPTEHHPEVEPYRALAIQLVELSREQLGENADKVLSREKAENHKPFNTHNNWSNAIAFLTAWGLVYESYLGGRNEGMLISKNRKVSELIHTIALLDR